MHAYKTHMLKKPNNLCWHSKLRNLATPDMFWVLGCSIKISLWDKSKREKEKPTGKSSEEFAEGRKVRLRAKVSNGRRCEPPSRWRLLPEPSSAVAITVVVEVYDDVRRNSLEEAKKLALEGGLNFNINTLFAVICSCFDVSAIKVLQLPCKFVEGRGFKGFVEDACPMFKIPSRWTVNRDIFSLYFVLSHYWIFVIKPRIATKSRLPKIGTATKPPVRWWSRQSTAVASKSHRSDRSPANGDSGGMFLPLLSSHRYDGGAWSFVLAPKPPGTASAMVAVTIDGRDQPRLAASRPRLAVAVVVFVMKPEPPKPHKWRWCAVADREQRRR
ncbi:hypothetical protein OSB04_020416 [Centaurea solstitialis]|uniref:Uncharacterized protein n=1 Tax=Centaurea solstitialis TaxID=347529 RepID=A0AA38SSM3_9ASTR|nr:hypothetical protein OSB04_020416 [Centaurea solstitialis]